MKEEIREFDAKRYLDSEEMVVEYLNAALDDGDLGLLLTSLGDVAKAHSVTKVAKESGLGRQSLYKAFSVRSKPRYDTIVKVLKSLGFKLQVTRISQ